jgi:hypothetical protein
MKTVMQELLDDIFGEGFSNTKNCAEMYKSFLEKENKPTLSESISIVREALKEDRDTNKFGYYQAWKEGIANAIIDECESPCSRKEIYNAATSFLNTLINQP